jgi:hypothetical protein
MILRRRRKGGRKDRKGIISELLHAAQGSKHTTDPGQSKMPSKT